MGLNYGCVLARQQAVKVIGNRGPKLRVQIGVEPWIDLRPTVSDVGHNRSCTIASTRRPQRVMDGIAD
jgi:hypothetical protein